jgi:hypothetical protein
MTIEPSHSFTESQQEWEAEFSSEQALAGTVLPIVSPADHTVVQLSAPWTEVATLMGGTLPASRPAGPYPGRRSCSRDAFGP